VVDALRQRTELVAQHAPDHPELLGPARIRLGDDDHHLSILTASVGQSCERNQSRHVSLNARS